MIDRLKVLIKEQRELILYCVIGSSGVAIDYLVFALLTRMTGLHYQLANAISVSMGICNNFLLNAYFNFKVKTHLLLRFFSFYCVGLVGLGISATLLYLFVEVVGINVFAAKLGIIFIVTVVQFILNKFVTFRKEGV